MSGGNPKDCLYHVWAFVRLTPGVPILTQVCLACGMHGRQYVDTSNYGDGNSDHDP